MLQKHTAFSPPKTSIASPQSANPSFEGGSKYSMTYKALCEEVLASRRASSADLHNGKIGLFINHMRLIERAPISDITDGARSSLFKRLILSGTYS